MSIATSFKTELINRFGDRVRFDERLAEHMNYGIGGPADVLVFPRSESDLEWISESARRERLPISIVGTGTNLLVHDAGIRGITIHLHGAFGEIEITKSEKEETWIRSGGGVLKSELLNWSQRMGLAGLEFSSGVPGTIGGGIFMNAGTKYGSYGDILEELRTYSFESGFKTLSKSEMSFGYRNQNAVGDALVVWATLRLKSGKPDEIQREIDRIIAERTEKQPLDHPSCGSTFKNPPGHSAGRLIERAGLKGLRIGGAEISLKHANFILNKEGATSNDVTSLIEIVQRVVRERFSVELEPEVMFVGGFR